MRVATSRKQVTNRLWVFFCR